MQACAPKRNTRRARAQCSRTPRPRQPHGSSTSLCMRHHGWRPGVWLPCACVATTTSASGGTAHTATRPHVGVVEVRVRGLKSRHRDLAGTLACASGSVCMRTRVRIHGTRARACKVRRTCTCSTHAAASTVRYARQNAWRGVRSGRRLHLVALALARGPAKELPATSADALAFAADASGSIAGSNTLERSQDIKDSCTPHHTTPHHTTPHHTTRPFHAALAWFAPHSVPSLTIECTVCSTCSLACTWCRRTSALTRALTPVILHATA
jgi:hypothetical protein